MKKFYFLIFILVTVLPLLPLTASAHGDSSALDVAEMADAYLAVQDLVRDSFEDASSIADADRGWVVLGKTQIPFRRSLLYRALSQVANKWARPLADFCEDNGCDGKALAETERKSLLSILKRPVLKISKSLVQWGNWLATIPDRATESAEKFDQFQSQWHDMGPEERQAWMLSHPALSSSLVMLSRGQKGYLRHGPLTFLTILGFQLMVEGAETLTGTHFFCYPMWVINTTSVLSGKRSYAISQGCGSGANDTELMGAAFSALHLGLRASLFTLRRASFSNAKDKTVQIKQSQVSEVLENNGMPLDPLAKVLKSSPFFPSFIQAPAKVEKGPCGKCTDCPRTSGCPAAALWATLPPPVFDPSQDLDFMIDANQSPIDRFYVFRLHLAGYEMLLRLYGQMIEASFKEGYFGADRLLAYPTLRRFQEKLARLHRLVDQLDVTLIPYVLSSRSLDPDGKINQQLISFRNEILALFESLEAPWRDAVRKQVDALAQQDVSHPEKAHQAEQAREVIASKLFQLDLAPALSDRDFTDLSRNLFDRIKTLRRVGLEGLEEDCEETLSQEAPAATAFIDQ